MTFKQGQSGNPHGRPPKDRTYADLINKALSHKASNGIARKRVLAELLAEAVTEGRVKFPADEQYSRLSMSEWIKFCKDLIAHLEPAPKQDMGLETTGEVTFKVIYDRLSDSSTSAAREASGVPEQPVEAPSDLRGTEGREDDGRGDAGSDTVSGG